MNNPKLSIIYSAYNVGEYIDASMKCVLNQSLQDIEVICFDDHSSDRTADILKKYSKKDSRIYLQELPKNLGLGCVRNLSMDAAKGEYIAFLDPDDLYPETTTLEKLYYAAKENDALMCGGNILKFNRNERYNCYPHEHIPKFTDRRFLTLMDYRYIAGYTRFIYQLNFLRLHNIRFPEYRRRQDPVFFLQAMIHAGLFYTIPDNVYLYRVNIRPNKWNYEQYDGMLDSFRDCFALYCKMELYEHFRRDYLDFSHIHNEIKNDGTLNKDEQKKLFDKVQELKNNIPHEKYDFLKKNTTIKEKIKKILRWVLTLKGKREKKVVRLLGMDLTPKTSLSMKLGVAYNLFDGEEIIGNTDIYSTFSGLCLRGLSKHIQLW